MFEGLHSLSTDMVQRMVQGGGGKRGVVVENGRGPSWQRDVVVIVKFDEFFLGEMKMKTRDDKRMVKL